MSSILRDLNPSMNAANASVPRVLYEVTQNSVHRFYLRINISPPKLNKHVTFITINFWQFDYQSRILPLILGEHWLENFSLNIWPMISDPKLVNPRSEPRITCHHMNTDCTDCTPKHWWLQSNSSDTPQTNHLLDTNFVLIHPYPAHKQNINYHGENISVSWASNPVNNSDKLRTSINNRSSDPVSFNICTRIWFEHRKRPTVNEHAFTRCWAQIGRIC